MALPNDTLHLALVKIARGYHLAQRTVAEGLLVQVVLRGFLELVDTLVDEEEIHFGGGLLAHPRRHLLDAVGTVVTEALLCATFFGNDGSPGLLGLHQLLIIDDGLRDTLRVHIVDEHIVTAANSGLAGNGVAVQGVAVVFGLTALVNSEGGGLKVEDGGLKVEGDDAVAAAGIGVWLDVECQSSVAADGVGLQAYPVGIGGGTDILKRIVPVANPHRYTIIASVAADLHLLLAQLQGCLLHWRHVRVFVATGEAERSHEHKPCHG